MIFSSYAFIFGFLPITLVGFLITSRVNISYPKVWLCLMSLVFYGWWYIGWVPVLLTSIAFNLVIGNALVARARASKYIDTVLHFGVFVNLYALFYYKYMASLFYFFGLSSKGFTATALPLGISFFTFTQIAFLVDASQGSVERYSPLNYFLFVTFFPHLIAGPIVHHRDLMPQFEEAKTYRFQPRDVAIGLSMFSIGLAKKTVIADELGPFSDSLLSSGHVPQAVATVGVLAYSLQLYFDFSGYSDMAIGLARLFGIKFPINFASPYKSTSIIDFWQRWHITLTRFLTAYIYNPIAMALVRRRARAGLLTSSRTAKMLRGFLEMIVLPTLITMLLAGVWHGPGAVFLIFGALHGIYISVNHAWRAFGPKHRAPFGSVRGRIFSFLSGILVYGCVVLAQIFFRADSVSGALSIVLDLLHLSGMAYPGCSIGSPALCFQSPDLKAPALALRDLAFLFVAMAITWLAPNTQEILQCLEPGLHLRLASRLSPYSARMSVPWALAFGVILALGIIGIREGQPFMYFQF